MGLRTDYLLKKVPIDVYEKWKAIRCSHLKWVMEVVVICMLIQRFNSDILFRLTLFIKSDSC